MEKEREIDCGGVEAIVQQTLGDIQGCCTGNVVVGAVVDEAVEHEFVLADALDGQFVQVLEAFLYVVCAKDRVLAHLPEMLVAQAQYISVCTQDNAEVSVET